MKMSLFNELIQFILMMTTKYKIDDSHGITHSFNILHQTKNIYDDECIQHPYLREQEKVIFISSLIHDMCDKKYMDERKGMKEITEFLSNTQCVSQNEIEKIQTIVETISYSKVRKTGFPALHEYQLAYHIVREADLLCAYDVDRCMVFHLYNNTANIEDAFQTAVNLFDERVFKHCEHGLILLDYTKTQIPALEQQCHLRFASWRNILLKKTF